MGTATLAQSRRNNKISLEDLKIPGNDISVLKKYFNFKREDEKRLSSVGELARSQSEKLAGELGKHQSSVPEVSRLLSELRVVATGEAELFEELSIGKIDDAFVETRLAAALDTDQLTLPPKWKIGSLASYLDLLSDEIGKSLNDPQKTLDTYKSLVKLVLMEIALSTEASQLHASRKVEQDFADLKQSTTALLNGAVNTAIYSVDLKGIIKGWNSGAEKIFGYTAEEIIGKDFRQFYPKALLDQGFVDWEISETSAKGMLTGEGWRIAKGGRLFYGRVVLTSLKNEKGEVIGLIKTVTDETERKQLEDNTNALLNGAVNTAIYSVDLKGIIKGWNAGAENIFGFKAEEIIGKDFRQFYPKALLDKGFVDWEISETSAKGMITGEGWRIAKGGRLFYGRVVLTAQKNEAGEVVGLIKTVTDETERKKLEENTHALLNGAVNTAIYAVDMQGIIKGWNAGAEKIFGFKAEEIIGKDFRQFYPKELLDKGYVDWEIRETAQKGMITGEGWRLAKGGRQFYGQVVLTAQRNEAGEVVGLIKTVTDETERKLLADKVQEQRKELLEVAKRLSSNTDQVNQTAASLSSATEQSVAAVTETTATAEEVAQAADQMSGKAKGVSEDAKGVVSISKQGQAATEATIKGMARIREQMESIADCMVQLSNQSKLIGDIIATVDDLAQQSNLLAVNASIEAAKAGEQGKGFAVVAQEVRNLSQQSKTATAHVRSILNDIVKATSAATMATEQGGKAVEVGHQQATEAGAVIKTLSENIEKSAQAAMLIEISSQQQVIGMKQMVDAMESLKEAGQQNLQSARVLDEASKELSVLGKKITELASLD